MAQRKRSAVKTEGKKQRVKFQEFTAENDIRYRGPLNYQSFQLFGWICIVLAVVAGLLNVGSSISPDAKDQFGKIGEILSWITPLSLPFLLMANFSKILANKEGYKKQLLRNGGATLGIFFVTIVMGSRYFVGTVKQFVAPEEEVVPLLEWIIRGIKPEGFIAFNLFIDLSMCTLTLYFLNARPKRVFTGKKVIILRLLTLLPIAYEITCFVLKVQSARGRIALPLWSFPLLTMKPPMTFAFFVFIAFLVKIREWRYCRHGKTHEEYLAFIKTNRNSLHMSIHLCLSMIAFAVIDLILYYVLVVGHAASVLPADAVNAVGETFAKAQAAVLNRGASGAWAVDVGKSIVQAGATPLLQTAALKQGASVAQAVGIGKSIALAGAAPLMLLYSYTAEPKNKTLSLLFPVAGILLIVLIVLEAIRMGAGMIMGGKKIDLNVIRQTIQQIMDAA